MSQLAKTTLGLFLLGSVTTITADPLGITAFTITPSLSNISLSSDSETSVVYTITNNATKALTPTINQSYNSTGNNLSLPDNNCTSPLPSQGNCSFRVLIPGSGQPSRFTITPKVCAFSGSLCSIPSTTVNVSIFNPTAGLPTRAYEEATVQDSPGTTTLLGININNPADVISYPLGYSPNITSVVVSPDGSTVYATEGNETNGGGPANPAVVVLHVSSTGFTLLKTITIPINDTQLSIATNNMELALTPDGSSLFLTAFFAVGEGQPDIPPLGKVFRIDLNAGTATAISDPDSLIRQPAGIVVSPNGNTVYVGTYGNYILAFPVTATSIDTSNEMAAGDMEISLHPGLAIDPAGTSLYVGNESDGSVTVLAVNGTTGSVTDHILMNNYTQAVGLAVSPNGNTLYVAELGDDKVLAVSLSNPDAPEVQAGISGAFGLGLSPNGNTLYTAQTSMIGTTMAINANAFLNTPATISTIADSSSETLGNFVGP